MLDIVIYQKINWSFFPPDRAQQLSEQLRPKSKIYKNM